MFRTPSVLSWPIYVLTQAKLHPNDPIDQAFRAIDWSFIPRLTQPLYAEAGRHIYGACASPDGKYVLFTRSVKDLGKVDHAGTTMSVIRWADTPMLGDSSETLRARLPSARSSLRLDLGPGWEPHWTAKKVGK